MRFHVLAIPHTVTHWDYTACAYTQKVLKFSAMMHRRGHEVIHYGHERSQVEAGELVTVMTDDILQQAYGDHDWRRHQFRHSVGDLANQHYIRETIPQVQARARPGDFLCCSWGIGHEPIARAVEPLGVIPVENGIGYTSGHFARWRAYESHAVRTAVEGAGPQDWYSWVIPNYFDPADFDYQTQKQPWVLYLGRITELKGVTTCIQATAAAGVELRMAGQGRLADLGYTQTPDHVTELGYADRDLRRQLMSQASALIVASNYLEPFGGVVVEALLSGTPIITPPFGAFAEINRPGETGFLCHTLREFRDAVVARNTIDPAQCRARGQDYSLDRVAPQFEAWFQAIQEVYDGSGWMSL